MSNGVNRRTGLKAAYHNIHYFFDVYHLRYVRDLLEELIESAAGPKMSKVPTPAKLLFFTQQLEALCHAAFIICNTKGTNQIAAIPLPERVGGPEIELHQNYMRANSQLTPWQCFPWHLQWDEYHTPYIGLRKFVTLMPKVSWYKTLYEVLEHAFSNSSIGESLSVFKMLYIRKRLLVLIEACYLIEVRYLSDGKVIKPG